MKVACPKCRKDFPVPRDIISRGVARVSCASCGFAFVIRLGDPKAAKQKKQPQGPIEIEGLRSSNSSAAVAGEIGSQRQSEVSTGTQTSIKLDPALMAELDQTKRPPQSELTIAATKSRAEDNTEPDVATPGLETSEHLAAPAAADALPPLRAAERQPQSPTKANTIALPPPAAATDHFESYRSPDLLPPPPGLEQPPARRDPAQPGCAGSKQLTPSLQNAPTLTDALPDQADVPASPAPTPAASSDAGVTATSPPAPPAAPAAAAASDPGTTPPQAGPLAMPHGVALPLSEMSAPPQRTALPAPMAAQPPGATAMQPGPAAALPPGHPRYEPYVFIPQVSVEPPLETYAMPEPTTGKGTKVLGVLMTLIIVTTSLLFLFVLMQNEWSFDLAHFGSMVDRAFGGKPQRDSKRQLRNLLLSEHMEEKVTLSGDQQVLAVKGALKNNDTLARRYVYVRAILEDNHGRIITRAEAPAGNVFSAEQLAELTAAQLHARITPGGQNGKNLRLLPGDSIAFMVVIPRLPANYSRQKHRVRVEVSRAEFLEEQ